MRYCISLMLLLLALSGCTTMERLDGIKSSAEKLMDSVESAAVEPIRILTAQEAEQAALEHAGLTAQQVTRMRTELDAEDGSVRYEVEFYHQNREYSYKIDARTGEILSIEQDLEQ